jgi:hypothetical protein
MVGYSELAQCYQKDVEKQKDQAEMQLTVARASAKLTDKGFESSLLACDSVNIPQKQSSNGSKIFDETFPFGSDQGPPTKSNAAK